MKALIQAEPVRFVAAVQGTLAAIGLSVEWLTAVEIPAAIQAGWVGAVSLWLAFVTRSQVSPA